MMENQIKEGTLGPWKRRNLEKNDPVLNAAMAIPWEALESRVTEIVMMTTIGLGLLVGLLLTIATGLLGLIFFLPGGWFIGKFAGYVVLFFFLITVMALVHFFPDFFARLARRLDYAPVKPDYPPPSGPDT